MPESLEEAISFLSERYPSGAVIIDERSIVVDGVRKTAWWYRTPDLPESNASQDGIEYWLLSDEAIVPTSILRPSLKEGYRRVIADPNG